MAKITFRKVNYHAWVNNTFLQCYVETIVKLVEYKNGRMDLHTQNGIIPHVDGTFTSEYNGWNYTTKRLLGRPLAVTPKEKTK